MRSFKNWPLFIWPFTRIGHHRRIAVLKDGSRIELRNIFSADLSVAMELSPNNPYQCQCEATIDPKVIVDVGANIGVYSIYIARKFPHAKVYAIEPEESNYNQLLRNIRLNKLTNINPIRAIVSTEIGTRTLFLSTISTCHSIEFRIGGEKQTVESIKLSCLGRIDLLKVDIEGAEYEVFKDYIPDCKLIVMEVHTAANHGESKLVNKFAQKYNIINESPIYKFIRKSCANQ